MELELTDRRWRDLREALAGASRRFARLLVDCPRPDLRAVGHWTVAETAAHTAVVARLNAGLVVADPAPLGVPELDEGVRETTLGGLAALNDLALRHFPDRDGDVVARNLVEAVDLMLERCADLDPNAPRPWLGDVRLPAASLVAHQLNEIVVHGFDIARACSAPWPIPPADGAFGFEVFLMRLLGGDTGRLLGPGANQGRRVSVEFRSAHTTPVQVTSGAGRIAVTPPDGSADATVRFDPATLVLTIFRRRRLLHGVVTRRISVSGRRPWAAIGYLRRTRTP